MWEMAMASIKLFLAGKLFQDPAQVAWRSLAGAGATAVVFLGFSALRLPLYASTAVASFGGGILQVFLFRNLRYR
jgi:hypothetical protein